MRRAVIAADPAGAAGRREQARAGRQVQHWNDPNGMFTLCAQLTAEHGHAVWQALTSTAETWADDRTLDQRRADALVALVGRQLARDGDWQRWITDPASGELLDQGRRTYRPSERLRQFIRARDRRCRFPGCTTPAQRADLDHTQAYDNGGNTDRGNLVPLCRRHHRLKTHTRWTYQRHHDGTVTWTDPRGKKWRDPPPRE